MTHTEKISSNLEIRRISDIVEEAREFIKGRREGKIKSLKVASDKVNSCFMDGFDWNRIITIAGLPGSGKSTLLRQWVREIFELNPLEEFDVISFQFEMLGLDEVARDTSSKTNKSVKEIYSAGKKLTEKELTEIENALEDIKKYNLYVVDQTGTVKDIEKTILYHVITNQCKNIIVTLDHTLLVKPLEGDDEKVTIDKLMHMLVAMKKFLASMNVKSIFFILSQLNRNIESPERVSNAKMHYPNKTDLFGASSVYYSSDYVVIIHKPCLIDAIAVGNYYGPKKRGFPNGLPVYYPKSSDKTPMIYLHIIKERFGSNGVIPMLDNLSIGKITQVSDLKNNEQ